jgi:hypothetical protein
LRSWEETLSAIEQWNDSARTTLEAGGIPAEPPVTLEGLGPMPFEFLPRAEKLQEQNAALAEFIARRCAEIGAELDDTRRQQRAQKAAVVPLRSAFLDRSA